MASSQQHEADAHKPEPDWVLAKKGIQLLINNNAKEAENLFKRYPDSLTMFAGYSFAVFMDALMTFEDDKLNLATNVLKEVERKCTSDSGWLKSMKKVFGSQEIQPSLAESLETQIILADSQVCLAILTFLQQDISGYFKGGWVLRKAWKVYQSAYHEISVLYREIVGELQLPEVEQFNSSASVSSLESVGNSSSRKDSSGWDSTDKSELSPPPNNGYTNKIPYSHSAILTQNINSPQPQNSKSSDDTSSGNSSPNSMKNNCNNSRSSIDATALTFLKKSLSVNSALSKHAQKREWSLKLSPFTSSISLAYFTSTFHIFSPADKLKNSDIDKDTVKRLMGAVSFGYGLFQLGISLLPPSLLKLTNFLGFGGNRQNGIACLMYSRKGVDMRAPLATLSLLWFHTIVRPFYALDGSNVQAGVEAASQLLQESEEDYGQSALFLFFKGRVNRLNSDIPVALTSFQSSVENATQREIKILSLHEVGWCHLIQLDYCSAENTFSYLKSWSRWSRGFYSYLAGICTGACEASTNLTNIKEIRDNVINSNKLNQLDEFLSRRAKCCPSDDDLLTRLRPTYFKLLVYEMLYLWNALPSCNRQSISLIITDCESLHENNVENNEPMVGLSKLILGSCYCIRKQYNEGVQQFRLCIEERKNLQNNTDHTHISAFAQYEIGSFLIKTPETREEGKLLLQQLSQYKDYDFEQRLNVRVHSMLKHL